MEVTLNNAQNMLEPVFTGTVGLAPAVKTADSAQWSVDHAEQTPGLDMKELPGWISSDVREML